MKCRKFLFFLLFLMSVATGCRHSEQIQSAAQVVMQVSVESTNEGRLFRRIYTAPEKMKIMLNYLRKLDPYTATDITPDTFRTDAYEITVLYSDGTSSVYRQIYNQYFQQDSGPWKRIDPAHGAALLSILSNMPSDH